MKRIVIDILDKYASAISVVVIGNDEKFTNVASLTKQIEKEETHFFQIEKEIQKDNGALETEFIEA